MEYIFLSISTFLNIFLIYIVYRQFQQLKTYNRFFNIFSDKIRDFTLFLNSILKMNILYFDETIFELVQKVKSMREEIVNMIRNESILFDNMNLDGLDIEENLEVSDEKENLGVIRKNYGGSTTK